MARESVQQYPLDAPRFDTRQLAQREVTIGQREQAKEHSRQYHGTILQQKREDMFARACVLLRKTSEQIKAAKEEVSRRSERMKASRDGKTVGSGGEFLEIAAMLAGELKLFGDNARVIPTSRYDDYDASVDFVIEWDAPTDTGENRIVRVGVDFKQTRSGPDEQKHKTGIREGLEAGFTVRDLEFTVSDPIPGKPQEQLSVPLVTAAVDMDAINQFYADLIDKRTGELRDPLSLSQQRTLREEFSRNAFRDKLLTAVRENIDTQQQRIEKEKNDFRGNEIEVEKRERASRDLTEVRRIIDLQRRELGFGEVVPFRSREQQESEAKEKNERTQINKLLDEQGGLLREFFKDLEKVVGTGPEDYVASRQAVATPSRGTDALLERAYDPAVLKKITKRLPKEAPRVHDELRSKQIRVLLEKSPLSKDKYVSAKQKLEAYREARSDGKERDGKIDARIDDYLYKDLLLESVVHALRTEAEERKLAA